MLIMNTPNSSYVFGGFSGANHLLPSMPAFSAYNFLRNCNYFLETPSQESHLKGFREVPGENPKVDKSDNLSLFSTRESERGFRNLIPKHIFSQSNNLLPYQPLELLHRDAIAARLSLDSAVSPTLSSCNLRKQRSEKKPIPEEQKDDKYFERRRRNNQAAKKSRDARKIREDQIALKATILEHENAILRAQLVTLREEASSLRQMLLHRKPFEVPPPHSPLCVLTQ